jgi:hypothetical protein
VATKVPSNRGPCGLPASAARDSVAERLAAVVESRHSNRRQFSAELVPDDVVDLVAHAAEVVHAGGPAVRGLPANR